MSAVNPRFSLRLAVAFFAGSVAVEMVNAQDGRTDARGSFGVPLQPFSLHETADASPRAEPIRVAYYHRLHNRHWHHALSRPRTKTIPKQTMRFGKLTRIGRWLRVTARCCAMESPTHRHRHQIISRMRFGP